MSEIHRYGVKEQTISLDEIDVIAEEIRLLGYSTLHSGLSAEELDRLSEVFDAGAHSYAEAAQSAGHNLPAMNENDVIRCLPLAAPAFWQVVFNDKLQRLVSAFLGDYYILNQANGLINRRNKSKYGQAAFHRDLPYQHFVSSRPIAINALFALDDFTLENGATRVIPGTHHSEKFPSDAAVERLVKQIAVPRGTFIVLDCMLYHAGGINASSQDRRAVNHVFTIPMLRQQLHLPSMVENAQNWSERERKILGFGLAEHRSLEEWFASSSAKS